MFYLNQKQLASIIAVEAVMLTTSTVRLFDLCLKLMFHYYARLGHLGIWLHSCCIDGSGSLKAIREWNQRQLLLHSRTCLELRKSIRKEVPIRVEVITTAEAERNSTPSGDDDDDVQRLNIVQAVYKQVAAAGFLGRTLFELQVGCHKL